MKKLLRLGAVISGVLLLLVIFSSCAKQITPASKLTFAQQADAMGFKVVDWTDEFADTYTYMIKAGNDIDIGTVYCGFPTENEAIAAYNKDLSTISSYNSDHTGKIETKTSDHFAKYSLNLPGDTYYVIIYAGNNYFYGSCPSGQSATLDSFVSSLGY